MSSPAVVSEESELRKIQAGVTTSWTGPDSPFEHGLAVSLAAWDRASTFVVVELGCGTGGNSVPMIKRIVEAVRAIEPESSLHIFQMDIPSIMTESDLHIYADQWKDDRCSHTFLGQSFYDPYTLPNSQKANLVFSQAALHWKPLGEEPSVLSVEGIRPSQKEGKLLFERILTHVKSNLGSGGVFMGLVLGTPTDAISPIFRSMVLKYGAAFRAIFPDSEENALKMMRVPQVSYRLQDLQDVAVESFGGTWIEGVAIAPGNMPEMSEALAEKTGPAMLRIFWPDWFNSIWPEIGWDSVAEVAGKAMAAALLQHGWGGGRSCTVGFVIQF